MRIALLGGTGALGRGLALRLGRDTNHDVVIGSRDPERAREAVADYESTLQAAGADTSMTGFENGMAAERGDIVVLGVSPYHLSDLLETVVPRFRDETIVVTPAVGMKRADGGMTYAPPPQGSVAALVRERVPTEHPVVGAFHTLPADRLADLTASLDMHTLVFGDDDRAVKQIRSVADAIAGLETMVAGGLDQAAAVESLTPLLVTLGEVNDNAGLGLKLT